VALNAASATLPITYVANRWILVAVGFRRTGATPPAVITCTDTASNVWTDTVAQGTIGNTNAGRLAVFKFKPISGASVTLTLASATGGACVASAEQFASTTDDLSNVTPMGTNPNGDPVAVLPNAPLPTSLCYAAFYANGLSSQPTLAPGFTEISFIVGSGNRLQTADGLITAASNAWISSGSESILSIIEMKQG
jgi:hypothetical protein